jgi:hypothetical protein
MISEHDIANLIMRQLRIHRPIPQAGETLPDGTPMLLCKCNDFNEYVSSSFADHQIVSLLNELEDLGSEKLLQSTRSPV